MYCRSLDRSHIFLVWSSQTTKPERKKKKGRFFKINKQFFLICITRFFRKSRRLRNCLGRDGSCQAPTAAGTQLFQTLLVLL